MSFGKWLSLGGLGVLIVACGGGVSLGNAGSGLESDGGSGTSTSGGGTTDGGKTDCSAPNACGPAPGMPAIMCSDGSIGGNTGKCIEQADGSCGWEIRQCPPAACFDPKSGALDPAFKKCNKPSDCVVVAYQEDCCGSMHAAGVAATSKAAVEKCAADRGAGFPACDCLAKPTGADDGTSDPGGATAQVTCTAAGVCETTFKPEACGTQICTASQTCCSGMPLPEPKCFDGANAPCPVSQRKMKKDITYLSEQDKQRLSDELMSFPLATYRYKTESAADREHLGFIIDDVAPSPAVLPSGERVDLYGYSTMTVATLQVQARQIAELRREVEDLRRELANGKKKPK